MYEVDAHKLFESTTAIAWFPHVFYVKRSDDALVGALARSLAQ